MLLQVQQELTLWDGEGHCLGKVIVDRVVDKLVYGQFFPEAAFARVETLFRDYVEAANEQLLGIVGDLDQTIAALGLRFRTAGGLRLPGTEDIQIGEGVITFRLRYPLQDDSQQNGARQRVPSDDLPAGMKTAP